MSADVGITRRTVLAGAAGAAAGVALGGPVSEALARQVPLWKTAQRHGIVFGAATASWQFEDAGFMNLLNWQAALLFTQDDFLWYTLKPSKDAPLDFHAA